MSHSEDATLGVSSKLLSLLHVNVGLLFVGQMADGCHAAKMTEPSAASIQRGSMWADRGSVHELWLSREGTSFRVRTSGRGRWFKQVYH
jgi:hypothetical protein